MADIYHSPYHISRLSEQRGVPSTARMSHDGNRKRDVKQHLLFEISTEVANRGPVSPAYEYMLHLEVLHLVGFRTRCLQGFGASLDVWTNLLAFSSWWYLFRYQVEGTSYHSRIWRKILSSWTTQPHFGS